MSLEQTIRSGYDSNIKFQVQNVVSLINTIYAKQTAGEYTEEQAKKLAADLVREMRYGDNNYFWIDTYEGDNVVLLGKDTEGTNRYEMQDTNGKYLVKEIIANGRLKDGGFTDYWFPKAGETVALPKRSYSMAFEPYQWVIGTGNYTDYIDLEVNAAKAEELATLKKDIAVFAFVFVLSVIGAFLGTRFMSKRLDKDFKTFGDYLNTLSTGDFTVQFNGGIQGT